MNKNKKERKRKRKYINKLLDPSSDCEEARQKVQGLPSAGALESDSLPPMEIACSVFCVLCILIASHQPTDYITLDIHTRVCVVCVCGNIQFLELPSRLEMVVQCANGHKGRNRILLIKMQHNTQQTPFAVLFSALSLFLSFV